MRILPPCIGVGDFDGADLLDVVGVVAGMGDLELQDIGGGVDADDLDDGLGAVDADAAAYCAQFAPLDDYGGDVALIVGALGEGDGDALVGDDLDREPSGGFAVVLALILVELGFALGLLQGDP